MSQRGGFFYSGYPKQNENGQGVTPTEIPRIGMISSHGNGLQNAEAEDLAPLVLQRATDADPASAPGTGDSATSGVIDENHAPPHAADGGGPPNDFATDIGCAHPIPNSPPAHMGLPCDRGR